jgi:hypothetical protein
VAISEHLIHMDRARTARPDRSRISHSRAMVMLRVVRARRRAALHEEFRRSPPQKFASF